jgi:hypothetical protein
MNNNKSVFSVTSTSQEMLIGACAVRHIFIPHVPEIAHFSIAQLPSPALDLR